MSFQKDSTLETFHEVVQKCIHMSPLVNFLSSKLYSPKERNTTTLSKQI